MERAVEGGPEHAPWCRRFLGSRQSGIFFGFMVFLLGWEIGFFFDARGFFRASARQKKIGVFFLVFLLSFGGVFVLFGVFLFFAR